ncbi:flagellar hook protein FlgE [Jeotgalibacillus salarius]|uniref:Flagellar hook protein FlgE n=1 Tax=Jeotgalibacillus salarius TaxID=546023 RepID=A0A4Y8LIC0_9BACL|nr:flagellar hook-basal body complex protein [Jeotgalibacillus salarius]TFE02764.1 flagellar hook-basal body complex protein [Jeotgalibacillus salarius]
MIRSMYSGIAGLKNFQTKLDVIGNNIANVNTFGFKKGRVTFQEAMNQTISGASAAQDGRGGKNPLQVGLGSVTATIDSVQTQASLQTTGRSLDLAINGDGFFVVQGPGGENLYTRGGNFYLDQAGTLVNGDGYRVQQFDNGVMEDITINSSGVLPAQTSTEMALSGNLSNSVSDPNYSVSQQMKIVDDNGQEHTFEMRMSPNGATDDWNLEVINNSIDPVDSVTMNITFNADGEAELTGGGPIDIGDGGTFDLNDLDIDVEDLTNLPGEVSVQARANGNLDGTIESFSVSQGGIVNAVYSNGLVEPMASLSLASFNNPAGLVKAGNNLFQESVNSGVANVGDVETIGGSISAGSLEMSNVDLSEEFTEMITAQRGFQANTRIITTSDQILEELVNLKR